MGISHSHFLGGPPEWNDLDRAKVRALLEYEAMCCPSCGVHAWAFDPAHGGDRNAYTWDERDCPGCRLLNEAREAEGDKHDPARHVFLIDPAYLDDEE